MLTVNFFGGLAVDPSDADVIFVGDEARGLFRSSDGGDSFEETQPSIASACLGYGGGSLWSCTPGLPQQTALVRATNATDEVEPIMAFAEVDHLVDCAPESMSKRSASPRGSSGNATCSRRRPSPTRASRRSDSGARRRHRGSDAAIEEPDAGQQVASGSRASSCSAVGPPPRRPARALWLTLSWLVALGWRAASRARSASAPSALALSRARPVRPETH